MANEDSGFRRHGLFLDREFLEAFHRSQMESWPMAAENFRALEGVETRQVDVDGFTFTLQHNPARVRSTAAKVDAASLAARKCFLCRQNRPAQQHHALVSLGHDYELLVNPYPIFPLHFTIPLLHHREQNITALGSPTIADMLLLARRMPGMAVFYNGPRCGASAPDHFHFQAVEADRLPLLRVIEEAPWSIPFEVRYILADRVADAMFEFDGVIEELKGMEENRGEKEPRMNILATYVDGEYRAVVIPRRAHRPDFYGEGEGRMLLSPASVDLGGVIVVPSADDFRRIDASVIKELLRQTTVAANRGHRPRN